jgi:sulfatase maturation enzyme AslB (radical SAM superfamily)
MTPEQVRWLQVENTTRCNAWCPGCARNNNGFGLSNNFELHDLELDRFKQVLEFFPNLDTVQFCGTFGDTMAAPDVMEHILLATQHSKKLQIHTHGGFHSTAWWAELAKILKHHQHDVWFALDGLEGVHEIYRQGTKFTKIIDNARAFIGAGGHATWQFIPWQHNEHQIKDCIKLSQQVGFKKFKLVKNVRTDFTARHWKTGEPLNIKPWTMNPDFNLREIQFVKNRVEKINCMHLAGPSVYLNANGNISACCEFNIRRQSNTFDQLPNIDQELSIKPNKTCLQACGTHVTI